MTATDVQTLPSERWTIDQSCRQVVLLWYGSSVFWLLFGSLLALVASIKMHTPGFLADSPWLTFGRVRPAHLNTMIYGWASYGRGESSRPSSMH